MLMRRGVLLSPRQADLFDFIERSGEYGVPSEVLAGVFYSGKSTRDAQACIRTTVNHINDRLEETDIELRASRHEPYRLRKRKIGRL